MTTSSSCHSAGFSQKRLMRSGLPVWGPSQRSPVMVTLSGMTFSGGSTSNVALTVRESDQLASVRATWLNRWP